MGELKKCRNDLTEAALSVAPVIGDVLEAVSRTEGCLFSRLSGSGATCFALFATPDQAGREAARLEQSHPGWWVAAGRLLNSARG